MPRGAGLADLADGSVRRLASGGGGFETFYGFIGGENNQYEPALYERHHAGRAAGDREEGYHLTEDLTDRAVELDPPAEGADAGQAVLRLLRAGATHAPHHVAQEWVDKYRGQFSDGWDVQREQTLARQKELGVVPADTELTPATT